MPISPEMTIIIDSFKRAEAAIFNGKFERRDLEFIIRYCSKVIEITQRTLNKAAPAKAEQATNTQQAAAQKPEDGPSGDRSGDK